MMDATAPKTFPRLDESLLKHLPPFARLETHQVRTILDQATSRRVEAGVVIFDEGMPADHFYMLLDGYVRVVRQTEGGGQVTSLHIPAGQLLGIAKALGRDTYPATAIAASEAILLGWPMRLWDGFVSDYDGFVAATYKTIGERIAEMNDRIVEIATQRVEQRAAHAPLRLINQTGRKIDDGIEINFPITRQDLSEMTATTLHTVSRLLSTWKKRGLVQSKRKRITATVPHALVVLAEI